MSALFSLLLLRLGLLILKGPLFSLGLCLLLLPILPLPKTKAARLDKEEGGGGGGCMDMNNFLN